MKEINENVIAIAKEIYVLRAADLSNMASLAMIDEELEFSYKAARAFYDYEYEIPQGV